MSKALSKYVAAFYYLDKTLLVLSTTSGGVSMASFATVLMHQLEYQAQVLVYIFL